MPTRSLAIYSGLRRAVKQNPAKTKIPGHCVPQRRDSAPARDGELPHAPGPAYVIGHGHGDQYDEGEEAGCQRKLGELRAVANVHEEQHDERALDDRDAEGSDRVEDPQLKVRYADSEGREKE